MMSDSSSHSFLHSTTPPPPTTRSNIRKRNAVKIPCVVLAGILLAGIVLFGSVAPAHADCMRDLKGRVVCDRGQCVSDRHGVHCWIPVEERLAIRAALEGDGTVTA